MDADSFVRDHAATGVSGSRASIWLDGGAGEVEGGPVEEEAEGTVEAEETVEAEGTVVAEEEEDEAAAVEGSDDEVDGEDVDDDDDEILEA